MAKITPIRVTEQFQHFVQELQESFWGGELEPVPGAADGGGESRAGCAR